MKRLMVLLAVLAAALSVVAVATANNGNGSGTAFKAAPYAEGTTTWTCSGSRVVNKQGTKDSETCRVTGDTTGWAAGSYSSDPGSPWGTVPFFGYAFWNSDFNGATANSWTMQSVDNGDGTFTVNVVANF